MCPVHLCPVFTGVSRCVVTLPYMPPVAGGAGGVARVCVHMWAYGWAMWCVEWSGVCGMVLCGVLVLLAPSFYNSVGPTSESLRLPPPVLVAPAPPALVLALAFALAFALALAAAEQGLCTVECLPMVEMPSAWHHALRLIGA